MEKRKTIIYWTATAWLALGMLSTGIVQLLHSKPEIERTAFGISGLPVDAARHLENPGRRGDPDSWTGLVQGMGLCGFLLAMSGAIVSHGAKGDPILEFFGPVLLLVLTMVSWYSRPTNTKLIQTANPSL